MKQMKRATTSVLIAAIVCKSVVAYSSGAGSCSAGNNAVQSSHLTDPTTGSLADGGFSVSLGGSKLAEGTPSTFSINTDYALTIRGGTFRGFLMRLGNTGVSTEEVFSVFGSDIQLAAVCTDVGGVTHSSPDEKTEVAAALNLEAAASNMPLDVTIVVKNSGGASEYYYSQFELSSKEAGVAPTAGAETPEPTISPTSAIASPLSSPVAVTPTKAPTAAAASPVLSPGFSPAANSPTKTPSPAPIVAVASPVSSPVAAPAPTEVPSQVAPTQSPTRPPTEAPTQSATPGPTRLPTPAPTRPPTLAPLLRPLTAAPVPKLAPAPIPVTQVYIALRPLVASMPSPVALPLDTVAGSNPISGGGKGKGSSKGKSKGNRKSKGKGKGKSKSKGGKGSPTQGSTESGSHSLDQAPTTTTQGSNGNVSPSLDSSFMQNKKLPKTEALTGNVGSALDISLLPSKDLEKSQAVSTAIDTPDSNKDASIDLSIMPGKSSLDRDSEHQQRTRSSWTVVPALAVAQFGSK
jgi:hypothetical protein